MNRKNALTVGLLLLLVAGASAQDAVFLSDVSGTWDGGTKVSTSVDVTFTIAFTVGTNPILGATNGFEVFIANYPGSYAGPYSFRVPTWTILNDMSQWWDGGFFVNTFSLDGFGADTIGFNGFKIAGPGIPPGTRNMYSITTRPDNSTAGHYLCIDTCYYPPGGVWLWATSSESVYPGWDGPHCFYIETFLCPPDFINWPWGGLSADHCTDFVHLFEGFDPAPDCCPQGGGAVYCSLSDDGGLTGATITSDGLFSYTPTLANVGTVYDVELKLENACGAETYRSFDLTFTNSAPIITGQPTKTTVPGHSISVTLTADDVDCDDGTFSILGVDPEPLGAYAIDPASGLFTFDADGSEAYGLFDFTVAYSDGKNACECIQQIEIVACDDRLAGDIDLSGGGPNIADVTFFVSILFQGAGLPPCPGIADVNCSGGYNVSDLTYLVAFLFSGGPPPEPCG